MIRKRDDGTEVEVEYTVVSYGSSDSYSPMFGASGGDPAEIEIDGVYDDDGEVQLTDAERERIEQEICEIVERDGPAPMEDDVL